MSAIHTSVVRDAHSYTRSDTPWIMDDAGAVYGKLIHYISGGGMRAFGRTVRQEEIGRRHRRFAVVAIAFAVLWTLFWIF